MNYIQKIKRLYNLSENENYGFSESEILNLEKTLETKLPLKFKEYYIELGKEENLNYSYNRLLKPDHEIAFSEDNFFIFYEENQVVVFWGIKRNDLMKDDPPVYCNYGNAEESNWEIETQTTENFFLLMAVYNGTFGGLKFNGNFFGNVSSEIIKLIAENWQLIPEISWEKQKVYTNDYYEVITLSFDDNSNCTAVFIGSSNQERFDKIIEGIDIDWSYLSYDDEEAYEDDEE